MSARVLKQQSPRSKGDENIDWLYSIRNQGIRFLDDMKSTRRDGYYRFSYSGDVFDESRHWNIGAAVFALKIYYTLNVPLNEEIKKAAAYILTFKKDNGLIYDTFIARKGLLNNCISSLRRSEWPDILCSKYKRAETRQALSALMLYDLLPESMPHRIPRSEEQIQSYLSAFDWTDPWSAGSHFSHLMFFYKTACMNGMMERHNFDALTDYAIAWVNNLQQKDGSWHAGDTSLRYKINGAMKIITGLKAVDKVCLRYPERLIDLCLSAVNDESACDNFNVVLVLNNAGKMLEYGYRHDEIVDFCLKRLRLYNKQYFSDKGGFSFFPGAANHNYYGARITRGFNEPDMHGTVLFLWGIAQIAEILNIEKELNMRVFDA